MPVSFLYATLQAAWQPSRARASAHSLGSAFGDEDLTALAMVLGALFHGDASRLALGFAQAPIADLGVAAHRHRPALVPEPYHHFAIVAVSAAFLQSHAFGLSPTAPAIGSTVRLFGSAIRDGAIVGGGRGGGGVFLSALQLLLGASTVIIIPTAGPPAIPPCRRASSERGGQADEEEWPGSHVVPKSAGNKDEPADEWIKLMLIRISF